MNQRPTLREQIDACRVDSDDLHLPEHAAELAELKAGVKQSAEVRALWERSQRDERVVRGAMHDVSLPTGLEQRLLAAVQAAQKQPLSSVDRVIGEDTPAQAIFSVPSAQRTPVTSRRRWVWGTFGLTAAAAIVLAAVVGNQFLNPPDEAITKDQLSSQVQGWLQAASKVKWDAKTAPAKFPAGSLLGRAANSGALTSSQGTITVYNVKLAASSTQALLLVLPTTTEYPVSAFPSTTVSVSGSWEVEAWQKDGVLYVLAVRSGGDKGVRDFIHPQRFG